VSHRSFADFLDHVTESFANLFNLDAAPGLTEEQNVQQVISQTATVASIVSCAVPIPASDLLLLTPIQAKMAVHIGRVKGFDVTQERASEIVTEILGTVGMSITAQMLIVSVAKLVPFVGGFLSAPLVYASTWAIGYVVNYYFDCMRHGSTPSTETMKQLFAEQFKVGRRRAEDLDREDLKRKAQELRERMEKRNPEFKTTTRLDRGASAGPRAHTASPQASAPQAAPAPKPTGPRQKIKITLPPKVQAEPRPAAKTIGFGDEVRDAAPAKAAASDGSSPAAELDATELVEQLERLADLRQQGVLTEEEFQQAKERLLG